MVVIRGGGDLATGAALRLYRAGLRVLVLELAQPTMIRQAVSLGTAVYDGAIAIEGVTGRKVDADESLSTVWQRQEIPVMVDPDASILSRLRPEALVDGIMAKRNLGTHLSGAPIVVALGPGFVAGVDCHAVVETNRGHNLGRVYCAGSAQLDTGTPGNIGGQNARRVLRAPADGILHVTRHIGDKLRAGDTIGAVAGETVVSHIDGVLRGVLRDGLRVSSGAKLADVDPRGVVDHCFTVSDKAWAVGGGVLEAVLYLRRLGGHSPIAL